MTTPNDENPEPQGQDNDFEASLNRQLDVLLGRRITEEVIPYFQKQFEALTSRLPTITLDDVKQAAREAVAAQVVIATQENKSAQEQALREFHQRAVDAQAQHTNGHVQAENGAVPVPAAPATPASAATGNKAMDVADIALRVLAGLGDVFTKTVTPMMNEALNFQMKRQQLRLLQTDPVTMMTEMWKLDPNRTRYAGMLVAPDPMLNTYPSLVASAVSATSNAFQKGMLSGGWQPPAPGNGAGGAWVLLPDGRQVWDPRAPSSVVPPGGGNPANPGSSGGGASPQNPLGNPVQNPPVIDVTRLPGFGPAPQAPANPAAPTSEPSGAPAPTPRGGSPISGPPSGSPLPPTLNPAAPTGTPSSPGPSSPQTAVMGALKAPNLLLALKR